MQIYAPSIGEDISVTAQRMVDLANENGGTVMAEFNGIKLKTNRSKDSKVAIAAIMADYSSKRLHRVKVYRNSPEGKRAAADAKKRKKRVRYQMDEAMGELDSLDFSDLNAVISWLEKVRDPSDHVDVIVSGKQIVEIFRGHGYEPNVNCGKDFNGEDRENFARWLIGQALDNLGSI
ncbi:MAG: hypothetical protein HYV54_00450, partial [Parcubacteria group bacterium]|nr:hypothetical protein [Parcubacteria group bacterium]